MAFERLDPIICACGHAGAVKCTENDQRYSNGYRRYSLEGFEGGTYTVKGLAAPENWIEMLQPRCPKCGQSGSVRPA